MYLAIKHGTLTNFDRNIHRLFLLLVRTSCERIAQHDAPARRTKTASSGERTAPSSKQGVRSKGRIREAGVQPSGSPRHVHSVDMGVGEDRDSEHAENVDDGESES